MAREEHIFSIGDRVRVKDPDHYIAEKARRLRDRVGTVTALQVWTNRPIVLFEKIGRRQEVKYLFDHRDLALDCPSAQGEKP